MATVREERRRRIKERGSDRLALISGQLKDLPSPPSADSSLASHQRAKSEAPIPTSSLHDHKSDAPRPTLLFNEATKAEHQKSKPGVENPLKTTERPGARCGFKSRFFSPRHLQSSIINSEGTRSFCALIIALMVVLSSINSSLLGVNILSSDSILTLRPLLVLLLTDAAVVLARLYIDASGDSHNDKEEEQRANPQRDEGDSWSGTEKLLERGLLVYEAIRGIFIDSSVYLVVVICGLSFL